MHSIQKYKENDIIQCLHFPNVDTWSAFSLFFPLKNYIVHSCISDRPCDEGGLHAPARGQPLRPDEHGPLPAAAPGASAHSHAARVRRATAAFGASCVNCRLRWLEGLETVNMEWLIYHKVTQIKCTTGF